MENNEFAEVEEPVLSFERKYEIGSKLGDGGFASVFVATNLSTREDFAVKVFRREELGEIESAMIVTEYDILKSLNHENIVRVYDFYEAPSVFKIVMESVAGGELFDRIAEKSFYTEKDARRVMYMLLSAVKHCHERHVVHRDLKPENLLMENESDDASMKLVDFGFAKKADGNTMIDDLGTVCYMAPEIYTHSKASVGVRDPVPYGKPVDMWAVGVILFILLAGYFPFDGTDEEIRELTLRGEYEFNPEHWGEVSEEAKDLVRGLLAFDMMDRLTAQQALSHAWMQQADEILERHSLEQGLSEIRESIDLLRGSDIDLDFSSLSTICGRGTKSGRFSLSRSYGPLSVRLKGGICHSSPQLSSESDSRSVVGHGGDHDSERGSGNGSEMISGGGGIREGEIRDVTQTMSVSPFFVGVQNSSFMVEVKSKSTKSATIPIPAKFSGYMKKRPVKGRFGITAWQMRFFILERGVLSYYLRESTYGSKIGHDKKGEVTLDGFHILEVADSFGHVNIQLKSEKISLVVDPQSDRGAWVEALQKHILYKNG